MDDQNQQADGGSVFDTDPREGLPPFVRKPTPREVQDIYGRFVAVPVQEGGETAQRLAFIREVIESMVTGVLMTAGDSRERSIALTKLEEFSHWAVRAVCVSED